MSGSLRWRPVIPLVGVLWAGQILIFVYYLSGVLPGGGLPFDDAWIHLTFARHLAEHGEISFNLGQWSGGTSSILWVLGLALGYRVSGHMLITAYALGAFSYLLAATGLLALLISVFGQAGEGRQSALVGAMGFAITGFAPYLALSGMDTLLFLALGLWTLVAAVAGRRGLCGCLLAMLIITRIEGLALALVLALVILFKERDRIRPLVEMASAPALLLAAYFLFNVLVTGDALPTTMAGRKWLWGLPEQLWAFSWAGTVRFSREWTYLINRFVLAGSPGPLRVLYAALIAIGAARLAQRGLGDTREHRGLALLVGWGLMHNLVYLLLAPIASWRHQAPNLLLLPALAAAGSLGLTRVFRLPRGRRWSVVLSGLMALGCLVPGMVGYRSAFRDHVSHINQVHVAAGRWIDGSLPEDAIVAAFDIGAVKFFGCRETADLGGLTEAGFATDYLYPQRASEYLHQRGATHLAMPEPDRPGQTDIGARMGLTEERMEAQLRPLAVFQVSPYIRDPYTTVPYQFYPAYRKMTIYEIQHRH